MVITNFKNCFLFISFFDFHQIISIDEIMLNKILSLI